MSYYGFHRTIFLIIIIIVINKHLIYQFLRSFPLQKKMPLANDHIVFHLPEQLSQAQGLVVLGHPISLIFLYTQFLFLSLKVKYVVKVIIQSFSHQHTYNETFKTQELHFLLFILKCPTMHNLLQEDSAFYWCETHLIFSEDPWDVPRLSTLRSNTPGSS